MLSIITMARKGTTEGSVHISRTNGDRGISFESSKAQGCVAITSVEFYREWNQQFQKAEEDFYNSSWRAWRGDYMLQSRHFQEN